MSDTTITPELATALRDAAEAASASLPTVPMAAGAAGEGTHWSEFVPGERSRAVTANLSGVDGSLVLLVSSTVALGVTNGPLGKQELLAVVEPALERAVASLRPVLGASVGIEAAFEIDADISLASADVAEGFEGVPLFAGDTHEASLALLLGVPGSRDATLQALAGDDDRPGRGYDDDDDDAWADAEPVPAGVGAYAAAGAPVQGGGGYAAEPAYQAPAVQVAAHQFPQVADTLAPAGAGHPLRLLNDVEMSVTAELGRARMTVRHLLALVPGSVIELDRAAGSLVDLLVNGTLIARGEVVVIDEEFGVRISEIVGRTDDER